MFFFAFLIVTVGHFGLAQDQECSYCASLTDPLHDFQLTASSHLDAYPPRYGRISGPKGWCASHEDEHPYLQIDFLVPVNVNAITFIKWIEVDYHQFWTVKTRGPGTISVKYGNSTETDDLLEKTIFLNTSDFRDMVLEERKNGVVRGANSTVDLQLIARYLQLYPERSNKSDACVMVSICGCGDTVYADHHPTRNTHASDGFGMFRLANAHICHAHAQYEENTNSSAMCKNICADDPLCNTAVYNTAKKMCYTYESCDPSDVSVKVNETYGIQLFQKLYKSKVDDNNLVKESTETTFITFPGLVCAYGEIEEISWTIDYTAMKSFLVLVFENFNSGSQTVSKRYFAGVGKRSVGSGEHDVDSTNGKSPIITYERPRLYEVSGFSAVGSGRQIMFPCNVASIIVRCSSALTCKIHSGNEVYKIQEREANGLFRGLIYASELPFNLELSGSQVHVLVYSDGLLGYTGSSRNEYTVFSNKDLENFQYIEIEMLLFHVSCGVGSSFKIIGGTAVDYCNLYRPWKKEKLIPNQQLVKIIMVYNQVGETRPVDGFVARVARTDHTKHINMNYVPQIVLDVWDNVSAESVCSDLYCYSSLYMHNDINLHWANEFCGYFFNGALASISSTEELLFVRHFLERTTGIPLKDDVHLGTLFSSGSSAKGVKYWGDGKPVIFTAWSRILPSKLPLDISCVIIRLWQSTEDNVLDAINCDRDTKRFVCKNSTNIHGNGNHAHFKSTSQSSNLTVLWWFGPEKAVDGLVSGIENHCATTNVENNPWWKVDLGEVIHVTRVTVFARNDGKADKTTLAYPMVVEVGMKEEEYRFCALSLGESNQARSALGFTCNARTRGQYVRIRLLGFSSLELCEVYVYSGPSFNTMSLPSTVDYNSSAEFSCGSGEYLSAYALCDGYRDCADGSDEQSCEQNDYIDLDNCHVVNTQRDEVTIYAKTYTGFPRRPCTVNVHGYKGDITLEIGFLHFFLNDTETFLSISDGTKENAFGMEQTTPKAIYTPGRTLTVNVNGEITNSQAHDFIIYVKIIRDKCPGMFRCDKGACVPYSMYCDNFPDCVDGSDEKYCDFGIIDEETEFRCTDGSIISKKFVCDASHQCLDKSDEFDCVKCRNPRNSSIFSCEGKGGCISRNLFCNGVKDCANGLDESACTPESVRSCFEWWDLGFRKTQLYDLTDGKEIVTAECNFDTTEYTGKLQTIFHGIDFAPTGELWKHQTAEIVYGSRYSIMTIIQMGDLTCKQTFNQTCLPNRRAIAERLDLTYHREYWDCLCIALTVKQGQEGHYTLEACSEETSKLVRDGTVQMDKEWSFSTPDRDRTRFMPPKMYRYLSVGSNSQSEHLPSLQLGPITCESETGYEGDIRLVDGSEASEGVLKIFTNGVWGVVDGRYWTAKNAEVVCRQLGFPAADNVATKTMAEQFVLLSEVNCLGSEAKLLDCPLEHSEYFSSEIHLPVVKCFASTVRLVGGGSSSEGRLEVYHNTTWGTVCYDKFGTNEARVVCKMLGFAGGKAYSEAHFGAGLGRIWMDNLKCSGDEPSLDKCLFNGWGEEDCKHTEDAGVSCDPSLSPNITQGTKQVTVEPRTLACVRGKPVSRTTKCLYDYDDRGNIVGCAHFTHLQSCQNFSCPNDYAKCPGSFCIAARFFCDGEADCPNGEDEQYCIMSEYGKSVCVGYFRCRNTSVCIPKSQVCDGKIHCRHGDDERLCEYNCPENCSCHGYDVTCLHLDNEQALNGSMPKNTRMLDMSYGSFTESPVYDLPYLGFFNMSNGEVIDILADAFLSMRNLLILDLSRNKIEVLIAGSFRGLKRLKNLILHSNIYLRSIEPGAFQDLTSIGYLRISGTNIEHLKENTFEGLVNLTSLDMTDSGLLHVNDHSFSGLSRLKTLNISHNAIITFKNGIFNGLNNLYRLVTDAYVFCCLKPESVSDERCSPVAGVFSSCADLMRSDGPRFLLWIIGAFALLGNSLSLLYRFVFDRARFKIGYGVFVTNLTIADFFMGIYLVIIAGADAFYRQRYIWNDKIWRHSALCGFAGFLSTLSSEASVFFICLITLDRVLVIKYPYGDIRFTTKIAVSTSGFVWILALLISTLPLVFTDYFQDSFYSSNAVCLALPLTRNRPAGWEYSVTIFIFFNFLTFLLIAVGQIMIYHAVSTTGKAAKKQKRQGDLVVARNLLLVVSTDFLCWCPIGVMGLMAMADVEIPGEVYVWATVLILPINSALNPFLYTVSAIVRKKKFAPAVDEQVEDTTLEAANVLKYFDVETMKRVFGSCSMTLDSYIQKAPKVSFGTAVRISCILAQQINNLHQLQLCIGEFGPDDVRIAREGNSLTAGISLSPKQTNRRTDRQTDIYSLGLISDRLIRASKGKQPKRATSAKALEIEEDEC